MLFPFSNEHRKRVSQAVIAHFGPSDASKHLRGASFFGGRVRTCQVPLLGRELVSLYCGAVVAALVEVQIGFLTVEVCFLRANVVSATADGVCKEQRGVSRSLLPPLKHLSNSSPCDVLRQWQWSHQSH